MASEEGAHSEVDTDLAEPKPSTGESQGIAEEGVPSGADTDVAEPKPSTGESRDIIDEAAALKIAVQTLKANDALPEDSSPTVELRGDRYTVVYPRKLAPGVRGSAFHVKVHIVARPVKVLGLQGGV